MQIYQIFIPELHANVKFKVLPNSEAEEYIKKRKPDSKAFRKDILQMVVFNLNTEVAASLNMMSRVAAERALEAIYAGCIMLNPGLDIDYWINIAYSTAPIDPIGIDDDLNIKKLKEYIKGHAVSVTDKKIAKTTITKQKKLTKDKFMGLQIGRAHV